MLQHILDTDLYKFSTSYAYFKLYPNAEGTFEFKDRNKELWNDQKDLFLEEFGKALKNAELCTLGKAAKNWCIKNIPYIPRTYWEWLTTFKFDKNKVEYYFDTEGVFHCTVTDKLYKVTFYEILILSTFSEIRNKIFEYHFGCVPKQEDIIARINEKINYANKNGIVFSEFGTRRRYSSDVQEIIISELCDNSKTCAGTSNVFFAMKYGMKPIGTFPHEWVMFHGAIFGYKRANYLSLEDWIDVYQGDLGTALIDTYTTDSFLNTLTKKQAHLLSGFRQDSGDEFEVGDKILQRVESFGIDPKSKLIVFSNALDFPKAKLVNDHFKDKCKVSFGIGTNLTNDTGVPWNPANIVMKLLKCRLDENSEWEDCFKISDDKGKFIGNQEEVEIARKQLKLK